MYVQGSQPPGTWNPTCKVAERSNSQVPCLSLSGSRVAGQCPLAAVKIFLVFLLTMSPIPHQFYDLTVCCLSLNSSAFSIIVWFCPNGEGHSIKYVLIWLIAPKESLTFSIVTKEIGTRSQDWNEKSCEIYPYLLFSPQMWIRTSTLPSSGTWFGYQFQTPRYHLRRFNRSSSKQQRKWPVLTSHSFEVGMSNRIPH